MIIKKCKLQLLFLPLLFLIGCKEPTIELDGIQYSMNTGYNAEKTHYVDLRDSNVYKIITIGDQRWMSSNLRYDKKGSWYNPDNPSKIYGRLYDWPTLINGDTSSSTIQGLCPKGWHIPSDEEWKRLEISIGLIRSDADIQGSRGVDEAIKIKSATQWNNANGTNSTGFNAFPAGIYRGKRLNFPGDNAAFWTSTKQPDDKAWARHMGSRLNSIDRFNLPIVFGLSCRCIENQAN